MESSESQSQRQDREVVLEYSRSTQGDQNQEQSRQIDNELLREQPQIIDISNYEKDMPDVYNKLQDLYEKIKLQIGSLSLQIQEDMSDEKKNAINKIKEIFYSITNKQVIHIFCYFIQQDKNDLRLIDKIQKSLEEEYKSKSLVRYYLEKDEFIEKIKIHGQIDNQIILVISCENFNNQEEVEEVHDCLNKLEEIKQKNKNINIKKLIFQVQNEEQSQKLQEYVKSIRINCKVILEKELLNEISLSMIPLEFRRVIPTDDLTKFFRCQYFKDSYLKLHTDDFSQYNLFDYNPEAKEIKLEEQLSKAVEIIKRVGIKVDPLILSPNLPKRLSKDILIYYKEAKNDEQNLCKRIIKLYTSETCFMHKFVNGCLYTLNEEIIKTIWNLILMVRIALYKYNDQSETSIKKDSTEPIKLYRGISLSKEYFQKVIKVGAKICLASFSSFSSSKQVAYNFIKNGDSFIQDDESFIFEFEYTPNSKNYDQRPKAIFEQSKFKGEHEYLLAPGCIFKIENIEQKNNTYNCYQVQLSQIEAEQI
ncbi:hypothetical protein ABPG74_018063 [Tetrahymena malaccensis]